MLVLIGSKNPGKIEGAQKSFNRFFKDVEIIGVKVPSDVNNQPVNEDIYKGAKNRVLHLMEYAKENKIDADYFVAVESGISNGFGKWTIVNIAVIMDKTGKESWGNSSGFPVPNKYVNSIIATELGMVMDEIFTKHDLRSTVGGISYLTHENITRIDLNESAFIMALTQFVNGNLWSD